MGKPNLHIGYFAGFAVEITGVVKGYSMAEYIGFRKRTRGSETSQYPQERTSTETPLVVASERGPGQCRISFELEPSGKLGLSG